MIRDLRLTVYDFIGYLLPGMPALIALMVLGWPGSGGGGFVTIPGPSGDGWIAAAIASYLLGHIVQALANLVVEIAYPDEVFGLGGPGGPVPRELYHRARAKLYEAAGAQRLSAEEVYALADEWVAQHGNTADRELYLYREGFYRGFSVSLVWLAVGLLIERLRGVHSVTIAQLTVTTMGPSLWLITAGLVLGAVLFFMRYRRFAKLRVGNAVLGFLALAAAPGQRKVGA